jgi:glycosyltransferase involved in cell wall biosynthesis
VGDIEDMARNAIRLLKDEEMLNRFSHAALARAKEYDIDKIVPHYVKYYEEVLERSKLYSEERLAVNH